MKGYSIALCVLPLVLLPGIILGADNPGPISESPSLSCFTDVQAVTYKDCGLHTGCHITSNLDGEVLSRGCYLVPMNLSCFAVEEKRVCLCDTNLCNSGATCMLHSSFFLFLVAGAVKTILESS